MTHPLDKYDDTDMTEAEFDQAFAGGEVVEQRPRLHSIVVSDSSLAVYDAVTVPGGVQVHEARVRVTASYSRPTGEGTVVGTPAGNLRSLTTIDNDDAA